MMSLRTAFGWGQRASDRLRSAAPKPRRDFELETVIRHEAIAIRFQPQISLATGAVEGAEALARWRSEGNADTLFARAASSGLSERLSRLAQRKALRMAAAWEGPLKRLSVSINLLPQDLARTGFERWLLEEIDSAGIDPARVTAEITESVVLSDSVEISNRLTRLRESGVRTAIDDFGTGYASLAYLARLPLDCLKIDRGLIAGIATRERNRVVVRSIIRLARDLGLKVVVEGVECPTQRALLAEWGCDLYQGFLAAKALEELELARFVTAAKVEQAA